MRKPFTVSGGFNAATAVDLLDVGTLRTIWVTKITLSIITHVNAKFCGVQDSAGTPVLVAKHNDLTAAAGVPSTVVWDFGPTGFPLTAGKKLQNISEASGFDTGVTKAFTVVQGYHERS